MPKFRYVGPSALPVAIPAAGVVTDDKGVIEVDTDIAEGLAAQPDTWQPLAASTKKETS